MEAILRVSRSRQHALTTALRVDMAYLCVDVRTVFSLLLAPLFSVIFQGEAYGDGFGYRMGVIMTVFICAMWVLTMAVADLQNGYRLRGIISGFEEESGGCAICGWIGDFRIVDSDDCSD